MTSPDWQAVAAQLARTLLTERTRRIALSDAVLRDDTVLARELAGQRATVIASMFETDLLGVCNTCKRHRREDSETVESLRENLGVMAERLQAARFVHGAVSDQEL
jgi:hypothetical protein